MQLDLFMHEVEIEVVPFDAAHSGHARAAWLVDGKGRYPAGLSLGDCFSYALANSTGEPLLFTGEDFARTLSLRRARGCAVSIESVAGELAC